MGPVTAISTVFSKIFTYSGRASRSEFWWYYLACVIIGAVCIAIDSMTIITLVHIHGEDALFQINPFELTTVWSWIITMPPYLSVSIRRLHDAGFSGFWMLLHFIPLGSVVVVILQILPSQGGISIHGTPATGPTADSIGRPITADTHQRAMQGYALLFDKDKKPSPEMQAARKAEISDYYRNNVLKPSA